jgi:hypothetical protein
MKKTTHRVLPWVLLEAVSRRFEPVTRRQRLRQCASHRSYGRQAPNAQGNVIGHRLPLCVMAVTPGDLSILETLLLIVFPIASQPSTSYRVQ